MLFILLIPSLHVDYTYLFPVITKFRIIRILGIVTDKENAAQ